MTKSFSIIHYEYKILMSRCATWGVLIAATGFSLLDNYPSSKNLARLEFLTQPSYFVYRIMSLDGLIIVFGILFLLSNRLTIDIKTGVKSLIMASPVSREEYILGKLTGGFLYTFTILSMFIVLNTSIYIIAAPFPVSVKVCIVSIAKIMVICVLPISFFISFISVSLPAVIDVRLFYLLASLLFILNATTVGTAESMPFYLITSGDLIKLIWHHPKITYINHKTILSNLIFLTGYGCMAILTLYLKRNFWRRDS